MDKNFLKNYIDNALACESELSRIERQLENEIRNFIRYYNIENGRKETELILFGHHDDIFYDFYRGRNLTVDGVKLREDGDIVLHLVSSNSCCGLNSDGETNMEGLIEALNSLLEEEEDEEDDDVDDENED